MMKEKIKAVDADSLSNNHLIVLYVHVIVLFEAL